MHKKNDNIYTFVSNKINYSVEDLGDAIEIYETDNPSGTGFVFDNMKQFILFINNITDIAEEIGECHEVE